MLDTIIASFIAIGCAVGVGMISIAIGCILSPIWTLEKMKGLSYVERNIENSDDITKFSRTIEGKYFIEFRAYGGYEYEARQYRRNFPYSFAIEDMISKYTGDNIFPFMLAFMIDAGGVINKHPIEYGGRPDLDNDIVRSGYRLAPKRTVSVRVFLNFEPNLPIRESPISLFEKRSLWILIYNFAKGIGPFIMAVIRAIHWF